MTRTGRRALLALLLAAGLAPRTAPAQQEPPPARPTVGLVLSGGGARGLAHVGVLEVLEELRIPVDAIAGTSMGAIVGGLYASGLSATELRSLLDGVRWERILADAPPRTSLDPARRAAGRRYGVELELGLAGAPALPGGLIAGQDLGLFLRHYTLPVAAVDEFSRLPIPFAAVATDIATGERVVLDRGDLVHAMRASMAIPVVFSPVEREGRLLVDGGIVDNLPVDLARSMGVDVVIAVDVTPPLLDRDEVRDLLGVSEQLVILLGRQDRPRQLALADAVVALGMEDVGLFDFRDADSIVAGGAAAARAAAQELSRWSLSEVEYRAHLAERARRRPVPPARPSRLAIDGPPWLDPRLVHARVDPALLDTLDPALAESAARAVFALGEFERVGYDLASDGALVIEPLADPRGPRVVRLGIDLATDSAREGTARLSFQGIVGYVRTRIGARAAEWRADLRAGTVTGVETAYHQPLDFGGRWFVEPSARAVEIQRPVFAGGANAGEYETRLVEGAIDAGRAIGLSLEARAGLARGRATSEPDGAPLALADLFPTTGEDVGEVRASLVLDRVDAVNLPRHGVYARAEARASRAALGGAHDWTRFSLETRAYASAGPHTWLAGFSGGAAAPAGRLPAREAFLLGGFGSLSGYGDGELRGAALAAARAGWLRRVAEIPPALRAIVAGGWVEAGDAWDPSRDESFDPRFAVTAALGAETILGPLFLAVSRAGGGRGRLTVSLGRAP